MTSFPDSESAAFMLDDAASMPAAVDLLLCCARTRLDARVAERIHRLAAGPVNWVELVGLAQHHGVLPLVWSGLRTACPDAVPSAVVRELDGVARRCAERSRRLAGELLTVLALLGAEAIAAIPLKGPVLSAAVYGDLSLRESVDIDILVRRREAVRARRLLLAAGYKLETQLNRRGFPSPPGEYEFNFTHPGRRTQLELCWRIAPEAFLTSLDLDDLNERVQPVRLLDTPVAHVLPEEQLLMLCIHGGKHGWVLLKWICDLAELVRAYPALDWDRVWNLARRLGWRRAVALGLLLAYDLVDAPLPPAVLSKIQAQAAAQRLAGAVRAELFTRAHSRASDAPALWSTELVRKWGRRRYYYDLVERGADKLWNGLLMLRLARLVLRLLVPTEKDRRVLPLPGPLAFLYYSIRPVRVAVQCVLQSAARHFAATLKRIRPAAARPG